MQKDSIRNSNTDKVYAGFFVRLAAYALDWVILFFGLLIVRLLLWTISLVIPTVMNTQILFQYSLRDILIYIAGVSYFILFTGCTGMTLGKRALHLKVIDEDGKIPGWISVIYRETIGRFLSSFILCIGYFMIGVQKEKRGLHDILADTYVIYNFGAETSREETKAEERELVGELGLTAQREDAAAKEDDAVTRDTINYEREGVRFDEDI